MATSVSVATSAMPGPTRGSGALGASGALGTPCLQPLRALLCPSAPWGKHGSPGFPTCHCHDWLLRYSDVVRRPPSHLARAWPWPVRWACRRWHPSLSGWPGAAAPWLSLPSGHASPVIPDYGHCRYLADKERPLQRASAVALPALNRMRMLAFVMIASILSRREPPQLDA